MPRADAVARARASVSLDYASGVVALKCSRYDSVTTDAGLGEVAVVAFVARVAPALAAASLAMHIARRDVAGHLARRNDGRDFEAKGAEEDVYRFERRGSVSFHRRADACNELEG